MKSKVNKTINISYFEMKVRNHIITYDMQFKYIGYIIQLNLIET